MQFFFYQATQIDFLKATSNWVEEKNVYGSVEVKTFGDVSVVSKQWPPVKNGINSCNEIMMVFMNFFGINKDADFSPLCENFKTVSDILEEYIDYRPI